QDSVTFTSKNQNKIDINNDEELKKYIGEKLVYQIDNIDVDNLVQLPDLIENVRKFLKEIPDFEENPPKFKFKTKYTSENEGKYTLFATPKNSNISKQIWRYNFQEINDPIEKIKICEENLLETFDEEKYGNIHKGIRQFFEKYTYSQQDNFNDDDAESMHTSVKILENMLKMSAADKDLINSFNSLPPDQIEEFLAREIEVIYMVHDEYDHYMEMFTANNHPYGFKNELYPLLEKDEEVRAVVIFWLESLGEDITQFYSAEDAISRLIKADNDEKESNMLIEKTLLELFKVEVLEILSND
ncbi:MAG: hypothetical protein PHC34_13720, partial [Candidatus Gastranaerophilales bacterium]|nr:hypothetical protein [Candidatus Gastranaerophilales bacterium]